MIADTVLIGGTILLLWITYSKIKFIVKQGQKSITWISVEFGASLIIFLFLLYSQFTAVHASIEQPFYLGDVYEASQYVSFASFLLPVIFFLTFMEIIVSIKIFTTRGRLEPEKENAYLEE